MTKIRLITWNVNSVRARLAIIERLLDQYNPDILCLQETKVQDHIFPTDIFDKYGLKHHGLAGQKSYHGVATLSKYLFRRPTGSIGAKRAMPATSKQYLTMVLCSTISMFLLVVIYRILFLMKNLHIR